MNRATVGVLLGGLALTAAFVFAPHAAKSAANFTPTRDDEVVERVPKGPPRAATMPLQPAEAALQARALIDAARHSGGDPRLLGRAQAVLAPWWDQPSPPPEVRILRATIKQSLHDFEGSLIDLDAEIAANPNDAQALLTRATVLFVLGRYEEGMSSCQQLDGKIDVFVTMMCRAPITGVKGHAADTLKGLLLFSFEAQNGLPRARQAWLASMHGEISRWAGEDTNAEASLVTAVTLGPEDTYSRLLLAELRLDAKRWNDAAALYAGRTMNDGELLYYVMALKGANSPEYAAQRAELDARIAANRQRGETLHRREESRYALALEGDVGKALALAKANWDVQKEPADARVLLEAAVAAKDRAAAEPVVTWLAKTGFTWPLLKSLEGALP